MSFHQGIFAPLRGDSPLDHHRFSTSPRQSRHGRRRPGFPGQYRDV